MNRLLSATIIAPATILGSQGQRAAIAIRAAIPRVLAISIAVGSLTFGASPVPAAAAGADYYRAEVGCDPYYNSITMTARASALPGFNSQVIAYRFFVWDYVLQQPARAPGLTNGWTEYGFMQHTRFVSTSEWTVPGNNGILVSIPNASATVTMHFPDGYFQVYTRYNWQGTDGVWTDADGNANRASDAWTLSYTKYPFGTGFGTCPTAGMA